MGRGSKGVGPKEAPTRPAAQDFTQDEILELTYSMFGERKRWVDLAKAMGLNPRLFRRTPPTDLDDFKERYKQNFWGDFSAGHEGDEDGSAKQPVCVAESFGQLLARTVPLLYLQNLSAEKCTAVVEHICPYLIGQGISPAQVVVAWNGRSGEGRQIVFSEGSAHTIKIEHAVIHNFDEARQAMESLHCRGGQVPALLVAREDKEVHAMMAEGWSSPVFKCRDYRKAAESWIPVGREAFVQLFLIRPVIVDGEGLEVASEIVCAIERVFQKVQAAVDGTLPLDPSQMAPAADDGSPALDPAAADPEAVAAEASSSAAIEGAERERLAGCDA